MKKWFLSIFAFGLLLVAGTAVFAQVNGSGAAHFEQMKAYMNSNGHHFEQMKEFMNGNSPKSFEEMKPYMKEMHPGFSEKDLNEMYTACHGK